MAFGFGALPLPAAGLAPEPTPVGQVPLSGFGFGPLPAIRRSVIDPATGNVTQGPQTPPSALDIGGAYLDLLAGRAKDAVTAPQRALSGELQVWNPETGHTTDAASEAASGMAGLAMTGGLGGVATRAGETALGSGPIRAYHGSPHETVGPMRIDPAATKWDLYHGSTSGPDFQKFDPSFKRAHSESDALFFAPSAETAAEYAAQGAANGEAGPRIFRASVEPGKTQVFDLAHLAETDPAFNARAREILIEQEGPAKGRHFDRYMDDFIGSRERGRKLAEKANRSGEGYSNLPGVSWDHGHIGAAVERAKAQGLDTAILRGIAEHGGDDQVVALTPNRVRSHYSPDQLLYGVASLAALPPAIRATIEANQSPQDEPSSAPFGFGPLPRKVY